MIKRWLNRANRKEEAAPRTHERYERSVVFLHHSYYHFYYLSAALRKRGWNAISVSLEAANGRNSSFYHGEDFNLYDSDPKIFQERITEFVAGVPGRFKMVHFAGDGMMAVAPRNQDAGPRREVIPWEFLEWKRAGVKIGYSAGGCADGISSDSFYEWSLHSCDNCSLRQRADVCSPMRNLAWGHKREMFCDLIATEMLPALDYCAGPKCYREPLTMGCDANAWRPDLDIPEKYRGIRNSSEEILVYHGVGNFFDSHYGGARDYKGTRAIKAAVDKLAAEGLPVRLLFVHDVPSSEVRYIQVQADIVVDQLNFGRYGANGRECMMLGRPVVGRIIRSEPQGVPTLSSLNECPIVDATEDSIEVILRDLVMNPARRQALGQACREYAVKWHSSDALAERYEAVYDWVMAGKAPAEAPVFIEDKGEPQ